jgi:hypothetical protein
MSFLIEYKAGNIRVCVLDDIFLLVHTKVVAWEVELHDDFVPEYHRLHTDGQDELLAHVALLEQFGPRLARPHVDTLKGSRHANMKELRFEAAGGVWRFAFAFDPKRMAIILCGGDKSGVSERRFYRQLINKADARFEAHAANVKKQKQQKERKQN